MPRTNTFCPRAPVQPSLFAGRRTERKFIEYSLEQLLAGYPINHVILGDLGIGKTSLLSYWKYLARQYEKKGHPPSRIMTVAIKMNAGATESNILSSILTEARTSLSRSTVPEEVAAKANSSLSFLDDYTGPDLQERFPAAFAHFANFIKDFYNCFLILIDEANVASQSVHLGRFAKITIERLGNAELHRVSIVLAGLPNLRRTVRSPGFPSPARVFEVTELDELRSEEIKEIFSLCLQQASEISGVNFTITPGARELLSKLSSGHPHLAQLFGYWAFRVSPDNVIRISDVRKGALRKGGALSAAAEAYFDDDFREKLSASIHRQVLDSIAKAKGGRVNKESILKNLNIKATTLEKIISTLLRLGYLKEEPTGSAHYRLKSEALALWLEYIADPGKHSTPRMEKLINAAREAARSLIKKRKPKIKDLMNEASDLKQEGMEKAAEFSHDDARELFREALKYLEEAREERLTIEERKTVEEDTQTLNRYIKNIDDYISNPRTP